MSFKEVSSLDADVTIAIGKVDKSTGKAYPKQAEGYYLGSRTVANKRGESVLHFLQTPKGNLGVWGTTDLNRKLGSAPLGSMVRVTSNGTKKTPNGEMYIYKVEVDSDNSIEVAQLAEGSTNVGDQASDYAYVNEDDAETEDGYTEEELSQAAALLAAEQKAKAAKVQEILNRGKGKKN